MDNLLLLNDVLLPAFVGGVLVIATHIPLGFNVLNRGIIFMDLAIAQVAGLGALLVTVLIGEAAPPVLTQCGAAILALAAALVLMRTEKWAPHYQEPMIGSLFVLAATAGLLILAGDPHAGEHMTDLLSGQILWVSREQLMISGAITGVLLVALWLTRHSREMFYALFAVAITVSVQLVGVYLVFATLIIPTLATVRIAIERIRFRTAFLIAVVAYALGLAGSALLDLPSGPLIVWALAICGAAAAVVQSKK